jgi:hypothetical protein
LNDYAREQSNQPTTLPSYLELNQNKRNERKGLNKLQWFRQSTTNQTKLPRTDEPVSSENQADEYEAKK